MYIWRIPYGRDIPVRAWFGECRRDGDTSAGCLKQVRTTMTDEDLEVDKSEESTKSSFDPEAETVTEDWIGVFIHTSWGYGQTNCEFARIIDVSDTGKTVIARRVSVKTTESSHGNNHLQPEPQQFGDEFRLYVRNANGEPVFRGTYPSSSDGSMDGPTRRDSFYVFDNSVDNSVRETATNYGH